MIISMHSFIIVFFTLLLLYSLLFNVTIEGLECGRSNPDVISKTNANEVEKIKKQMDEFRGIKTRVDSIETDTKLVSDGLQKMKDEEKKNQNKNKKSS
jgi:hypothetical protein